MAGYPPPNYNYGQQPPPPSQNQQYADPKAPTHGAPPSAYGAPSSAPYNPSASGHPPPSSGYPQGGASGYPSAPSGYPSAPSNYSQPPSGYSQPSSGQGYPPPAGSGFGNNPFGSLVPSVFPPGTDPNVVTCFKMADQDGSGFIDDVELQRALSSYNQSFRASARVNPQK